MVINAVWKIDEDNAVEMLQEAGKKLDSAHGEMTLDFSSVNLIDARMVQALEQLADMAQEKGVHVELCGVHVDVYKALKLVRLASRFSFTV